MLKQSIWKINILALFASAMVGCSDANPTVSILRSIEGFDFSSPNIVTASLNSVPLQANCSAFVGGVEMSFDGGTTWITPTSYDPSAKSVCENGLFSVTLSDSKAPLNGMAISKGQIFTVKFRALPRIGNWIYRDVSVKYAPSSPLSEEILVGSQIQTGSGLVLHSRLRGQTQQVSQGGAFKIRGRITQ